MLSVIGDEKMKNQYEELKIETILFDSEDVILTSPDPEAGPAMPS